MAKRKIIYSFLIFLLLINLILISIIFSIKKEELKVIFFDVGQGDAILISQGSNQILIDGGPDSQRELEKLGKYIPFWDRKIEIVLATHPDQDHIGGLSGVLKNYQIGQVIDNAMKSDSQVYKNYENLIEEKNINRLAGEKGLKIKMIGAEMEILYPEQVDNLSNSKDTNASSLVIKLVFNENSFLFTGDLPIEKENFLLQSGVDISAKILKVGHHGSKYSSGEKFLMAVNPQEAVISVGEKNRYGHPSQEVIRRLKNEGIEIWRTDEKGDLEYICKKKEECKVNF